MFNILAVTKFCEFGNFWVGGVLMDSVRGESFDPISQCTKRLVPEDGNVFFELLAHFKNQPFVCFSFLAKVLTNLSTNLVQKSKIYDTSALQSVFMLNNYNYITKSLHKYLPILYFI